MLTDAGPLVALVHRQDKHHASCRAVFESLREPMMTVWPAFTEAMHLLAQTWDGQDTLWEFVERGVLGFLPLEEGDCPRIHHLMAKYHDLPMDLADAALVRVAERDGFRRVFTIDRRDFSVYQPAGLGFFELLPAL